MLGIEPFVSRTQRLLEKERAAEIDETRVRTAQFSPKQLQQQGICLLKLEISESCTGLYGRTVLTLKTSGPVVNGELPAHKFSPGDIAGISLTNSSLQDDLLATGIVSRVSSTSIQVALEKSDESVSLDSNTNELYRLIKLANEITYKRLKRALSDLNHYSSGPVQRLINVLFGLSELTPPLLPTPIRWISSNLDTSQQEAVHFALSQPEVAVIHGPPGTGKTTTVVEIILQAVHQGLKVLALAPSNVAVDNLVERLSVHHKRVVRIGHPARVLPHIQNFCLDALISFSEQTKLLVDVRRDIEKTLKKLKGSSGKERAVIKDEIKELRREVRQREEAATSEVLLHSDVILATLTSAGPDSPLKLLRDSKFQLVVIDECSQALEAACWIGLLNGSRCVLAGDIHQLPPTILSQDAAKEGLGLTLMERVIQMYGDKVVRMLTTQYRMHKDIMLWPSQQLYKGRLQAHDSVASHLLKDLPGVEDCPETTTPLLLVDSAGCDLMELDVPAESSKGNDGEADVVAAHVQRLIKAGVSPGDIAVISPYNLQVDLIRQKLCVEFPKLEVKTVDGFQGREKEAIVISFVRSNEKKEVGFLAENRRINVAITRARRHLAVVCDTDTVSADPFLKSLVDYITEAGEVWSAEEYLQGIQASSKSQVHSSIRVAFEATPKEGKQSKVKEGTIGKVFDEQKKPVRQKTADPKTANIVTKSGTTDRTKEEKAKEFEKVLLDLLADPLKSSMTFSSSLTSYDRMIIHEVSERLGLVHVSSGEGKERFVVVSKSNVAQTELEISDPVSNPQQELFEKNPIVQKPLNREIVSVKKDKANNNSAKVPEESAKVTQQCSSDLSRKEKKKDSKPKVKVPSQVRETSKALCRIDNDDFDALLAAATAVDWKCNFKKCKTKTGTLGGNCSFCGCRFCLEHMLPELHGCGEAARVHARQNLRHEANLCHGGRPLPRHGPAERSAQLQRKLNKKLDELSQHRKRTTKKDDTS